MKNVAVLGSTGSIGTNTLKVLRNNGERFQNANVFDLSGRKVVKPAKGLYIARCCPSLLSCAAREPRSRRTK